MADAGLKRRAGGFALRPAPLPSNQGDGNPMVGHDRVQDADHADRDDKEKLGTESHTGIPSQILGELL